MQFYIVVEDVRICHVLLLLHFRALAHLVIRTEKGVKKGRPSLVYTINDAWYSPTLVLSIKIFVLGGVVTSFSTVVCINMQNFDIHQPEGDDWSILENDVLLPLNSLVQHAD